MKLVTVSRNWSSTDRRNQFGYESTAGVWGFRHAAPNIAPRPRKSLNIKSVYTQTLFYVISKINIIILRPSHTSLDRLLCVYRSVNQVSVVDATNVINIFIQEARGPLRSSMNK